VYLHAVFQQWFRRLSSSGEAMTVPILAHDILRPASWIQPYINEILNYYDDAILHSRPKQNSTASSAAGTEVSVIGLHLRIESDMPPDVCGNVTSIVNRLCHDLQIGCQQSICIVATGAPRWEYADDLPCQRILTKDEVWHALYPVEKIPQLEREESAMIDLWTVTRVHVFAGCAYSTMSIGAMTLHQQQLDQWRNDVMNSRRDRGEVHYGRTWTPTCVPQTKLWMQQHQITNVSCLV
jgi:hypothetical protein